MLQIDYKYLLCPIHCHSKVTVNFEDEAIFLEFESSRKRFALLDVEGFFLELPVLEANWCSKARNM